MVTGRYSEPGTGTAEFCCTMAQKAARTRIDVAKER